MANGIDVYFVDLTSGDPSEIGFEKIKRILELTTRMSSEQLMEQKILCAL